MKRGFLIVLFVAAVYVVMSMRSPALQGQGNGRGNNGQGNNGQSEVQRGFEIAPVLLELRGLNRSLVGEGSYYVNGISDCVGCHSGATGHLGGGVNFGGVFSRNLTPDAQGRPAGLTFSEFEQVIRFGVDFKGLPPPGPLVIMPWPAYRNGTDRYVEALYEYLRAIPCIEGGPGQPAHRC
jgi:hypothetical protein